MSTNFVNHCVCACAELVLALCNKVETIPLLVKIKTVLFFCVFMSVLLHVCPAPPCACLVPAKMRGGTGSPETEVLESCELLCGHCVNVSVSSSFLALLLSNIGLFWVICFFRVTLRSPIWQVTYQPLTCTPRPLKIWLLTFWFFSVAFIFYINYFLTPFLGLILSRCKWLKLKSFGHFFCNIDLLKW